LYELDTPNVTSLYLHMYNITEWPSHHTVQNLLNELIFCFTGTQSI
jgi:hypothetical protein